MTPLLLAWALLGCEGRVDREGVAMGTRIRIAVCPGAAGEAAARASAEAAFKEIGRLEGLWTTWSDASDVSRLNAGPGWVRVSGETLDVLAEAQAGSKATGGLFDVTFGPLGALWRFETPPGSHAPTPLVRVPAQAEIDRARRLVDFRAVELDRAAGRARLARPGVRVHLGGIGKGAAVDRAAALLRQRGHRDFVVQAGGDLYCAGKNGARSWRIGVQHPRRRDALLGQVDVTDAAFSTSGDYERFALIDGRRYHHIVDVRTGYPATASQSVTVLAPSATRAEVVAKAAFVLGRGEGLALLVRAGARGVIVDAAGKLWVTPGLRLEGEP